MFSISLLPVFTLILIMGILLFLLNYFYRTNVPHTWTLALKEGRVSKKLRKLKSTYPFKGRFFILWLQAGRLKKEKIRGDFAEVGVYRGDIAAILHELDPLRELHLFDTFEGFPASDLEGESGEAATYTTENFADVSIESVLTRFEHREKVHVYKGYFPETAMGLEGKRFALVNLDADLYKPTKAALEFFYPRLSPGGVIFVHDYNYKWPGIIRAVEEFIVTIPENIVLMPDTDGTIVIVKNK